MTSFFETRQEALACAKALLNYDEVLRVVHSSIQVKAYKAIVIGERQRRFFLIEEQFVGLLGFVVWPKPCSSRRLISSMKDGYYIETTTRSLQRIRLWNGKWRKPTNCLVLVGKIYYRLGAEISVE